MDTVVDMRQVAANTTRAGVFLLFNIALGAYILGTITLLVVKSDERTGRCERRRGRGGGAEGRRRRG